MTVIDNVEPGDKWEFDSNVAECFENMLHRSIPQYNLMRDSIAGLSKYILEHSNKHTVSILDIGCSDGLMIQSLKETLDKLSDIDIRYTGCDVSEPMLTKAKHRFLDELIEKKITILNCDLRTGYPVGLFDIVTSCLTIQFTPIEYRQHIIQNIYDSLSSKNGTFIMVEKVLGSTDILNQAMVNNYYEMKKTNGYSEEQIERKRLSLEGVLVPVTNDMNINLLKSAGFKHVDVFWRWMNFTGYIAIK